MTYRTKKCNKKILKKNLFKGVGTFDPTCQIPPPPCLDNVQSLAIFLCDGAPMYVHKYIDVNENNTCKRDNSIIGTLYWYVIRLM